MTDNNNSNLEVTMSKPQTIGEYVLEHGGGTFINDDGHVHIVNPSHGYAVSHNLNEERYEYPKGLEANITNSIYRYADGFRFQDNTLHYIGAWIDGGELVLDTVTIIYDLDDAVRAGVADNQEAIYDFENQRSIHLKG